MICREASQIPGVEDRVPGGLVGSPPREQSSKPRPSRKGIFPPAGNILVRDGRREIRNRTNGVVLVCELLISTMTVILHPNFRF